MKKLFLFFILFSVLCVVPNLSLAQSKIDTVKSSTSEIYTPKKSPSAAMLRSAIIPGWGQFYNEAYWKIPIIWGTSGAFIYYWIQNNKLYKEYADLYSKNNLSQYYEIREFYRNQRDLNAVFLFITYFLNVVDAYVDAHLFDFSVYQNSQIQTSGIAVKYKF
jgi:hypothetical protein